MGVQVGNRGGAAHCGAMAVVVMIMLHLTMVVIIIVIIIAADCSA